MTQTAQSPTVGLTLALTSRSRLALIRVTVVVGTTDEGWIVEGNEVQNRKVNRNKVGRFLVLDTDTSPRTA